MTKQHWEQIEQLWQLALQQEPRHRIAFVTNQNIEEPVRAEVLAMLRQENNSTDFLETPAIEEAARQLANDQINAPTLEIKGQRFGAYEVISELGAGGMGTVYLARDLHLNRTVAVKVLPEGFRHDPDRLKRFKREAEMLAKVNHPNVATLFDYDRESATGPRFLVMEYVAGETLAERLERGAMTATEAARIFRQIAEALAGAHAQSVIHRDLKPSNIKITPDGTVKVLDFGLAKSAAKESAPSTSGFQKGKSTSPLTLTQPQMILGTPGYMSPEQVRGEKPLDQRTDWWAFGCMLYEAMSGKNPFRSHTAADTNAAILEKEPDWKTLPIETPPALLKLIRRCLQKDARHRIRTAREILPLLESVKESTRLTVWTNKLRRSAPQLGLVAASLALLALVFSAYQWLKPQPETLLAVIAEQAAATCQPGQSEAIAKVVNDKLRNVRGVQLVNAVTSDRSQPFLMIDATLTQAALTAEATTILKVAATNCTESNAGINYWLTLKNGAMISSGTAKDLSQLMINVVSALKLKGNEANWQSNESDRKYYRAVALLEHYVNEESVKDALEILHQIEKNDLGYEAKSKAALGWGYYLKYQFSKTLLDKERAVSYCDQASSLSGNDSEVLLMCGKVATLLGNLDKAITNLQSVLQQRAEDAGAILALARAYEFKGEFVKAEEAYLRARALRPEYWDIYNQLGAFYFDRGEFKKSEENWKRVTELLDSNPCGFNNLGSAFLYQEMFDLAIKTYREALNRKPLSETYLSLGTAYLFQGDCERSREEFQKGKALNPNDAELWGAEGDALSCVAALIPQAKGAYNQAIILLTQNDISSDADYLSLLAEWQARRNNKKLALQKIEEALLLEPDNYDCVISAIKVYQMTNEPEKLMIQFEKAIKNRKSLFEVEHDPLVKELILEEKYRPLIEQQKSKRG